MEFFSPWMGWHCTWSVMDLFEGKKGNDWRSHGNANGDHGGGFEAFGVLFRCSWRIGGTKKFLIGRGTPIPTSCYLPVVVSYPTRYSMLIGNEMIATRGGCVDTWTHQFIIQKISIKSTTWIHISIHPKKQKNKMRHSEFDLSSLSTEF